jgi:HTH-type transcriptional regulator / antitoxin HigA
MNSQVSFSPDWVSAPGETIGDIVRERNLRVSEVAKQLGQTEEQFDQLLVGGLTITLGLARKLEAVLGGSPEFWLTRDSRYREGRSRAISGEANAWLKDLPLADMRAFGWIDRTEFKRDPLAECLKFFAVSSVAAWHQSYGTLESSYSFRSSPTFASNAGAVAAWLRQGEREASEIDCAPWSAARFKDTLNAVRDLTRIKDPKAFLPQLRAICAASGVAVAVVRSPQRSRASGATRFLTREKALMLLSFRYLSDDQFWFTFFHEAGHLLLHKRGRIFLEGVEDPGSEEETQANKFAAEFLIPPELELAANSIRANKYDLVRFARKIGVSPGIVVGQLQTRGRIKRSHFNGLKRRYNWQTALSAE